MNTKLTLSVEKHLIERAKAYAKKSGRSLSEIISSYLESLVKEEEKGKLPAKLKEIVGSVKLPENFDENQERRKNLERKHL